MLTPLPPAAEVAPPGYRIVQRLDLAGPLHLLKPWTAIVAAPVGPQADTGSSPVRMCFAQGAQKPDCTAIEHDGYPFQTFVDAKVETLSAATGQRALVLRTSYSGGSHSLTRTTVWNFTGGGFLQTFGSDLGDVGDDERFGSGPLDGYYVAANPFWTRPNETWWDPHRFSVEVYRTTRDGVYGQVLQYITRGAYPAERQREHQVIDGELPTIRRLLHVVYPAGQPF